MKILKIFLIVLIPAMGFVGCQKSQLTPGCSEHPANTATTPKASDDVQQESGSRFGDMSDSGSGDEELSNSGNEVKIGTTVVGSGDDDREGGDKKRKR